MRAHHWLLFLAPSLLVACALEASPEAVDATAAPIIQGQLEPGEDAVVLVLNRSGGLCSGSLISDRVVLTAKHCAQRSGASEPYDPGLIVVGIGANRRNLSRTYTVESIEATPGIYLSPFGRVTESLIGTDVALLTLSERVEGVTPLPISTDDVVPAIGRTVTAIGYGQTERGETGTKYRRQTTIADVRSDGVIYTARAACGGDSGSPLLLDGTVVGVLSFGPGNCVPDFGEDGYNRIDLVDIAGLIQRIVRDAGGCLDDGAEVCDGFDNDCNGEVDEVCTPLGEACTVDAECRGVDCRETVAGRLCTQVCDPLRPDLGCQPGFYCAATLDGTCGGTCVPGAPAASPAAYGAACERDTDCATLRCASLVEGGPRTCVEPCLDGAGLCFAGEACGLGADGCGSCVDAARAPLPRALGEACELDSDCASGDCLDVDPEDPALGRVCTRPCDTTADPCPGGFHCRDDVCLPGFPGTPGAPCVTNGDCDVGGLCATRDVERWCTFVCEGPEDCAPGFECAPVADQGVSVCAPTLALIGQRCVADDDCTTGLCGEGGRCTTPCDRFDPCGPGFECVRDAASFGVAGTCDPVSEPARRGGGCAVGGAQPAEAAAAAASLVGLLGLARLRRRRAPR